MVNKLGKKYELGMQRNKEIAWEKNATGRVGKEIARVGKEIVRVGKEIARVGKGNC